MTPLESVVGNMKVGAPLIMGAYGTRNDNPYPIERYSKW